MPQRQDFQLATMKTATAISPGQLNSLEPPYVDTLATIDPTSGTVQDRWMEFWDEEAIGAGNYNDRAFEYLRGKGRTGSLGDMWFQEWQALAAGGVSSEVAAVLARYSALTAGEISAITTFVDGLVSDGSYSDITEIYAPCLNATDYLIGMKFMTLIESSPAPLHTPGEFIDFTTSSRYMLDSADFDSFATPEGFMGVYNVFTAADVTQNSDLFGVADASNECYFRWRGNDTNDFNTLYNVTGATPRAAANTRPTGDIVGMGLEGTDVFNLAPGGIVTKAARTPTAVPAGHPCQWHGQNLNGTPAVGNVQPARYSLMLHSNGILSTVAQGSVRARCLQFLRDIGVTGVPAT